MQFNENNPAQIMVVDDHPLIREGIKLLLNRESDLNVCFETDDAEDALAKTQTYKCHLIILDLSLGDTYSYDLIRELGKVCPSLRILVLSMHEESIFAERVLRLGAQGYVMKQEASETLLLAIRQILAGELYISNRMRTLFLRQMIESKNNSDPRHCLTSVEIQIIEEIGNGLTNQEISIKFGRSIKTIEAHRSNIRRKLNLHSGRELNKYAVQWVKKSA